MGDRFRNVKVPFQHGHAGEPYLTGLQLVQFPYLQDFVKRFSNVFRYDPVLDRQYMDAEDGDYYVRVDMDTMPLCYVDDDDLIQFKSPAQSHHYE